MNRNADTTTRNADGAITEDAFALGHWEAMQVGLALDAYAATLREQGQHDSANSTANLARVFSAEALYTIKRVLPEW